MKIKSAVWILSVLLFWTVWSASTLSGLANGPAGETSGCVDDTWTATRTVGTPSARQNHTAVWTGSEMLVWGGVGGDNTGGRYDPATDTWAAISTNGAPSARARHTAVWTGSEMLVWGGCPSFPCEGLNTGGRYDPATDTWTAISTNGAPSARARHTAVWTGSEMLVWGGEGRVVDCPPRGFCTTGGRYDPATDTWTAISVVNAPSARAGHTAVWTDTEMLVWGGYGAFPIIFNTGGRYDPATDTWTAISVVNAPSARAGHTAVWTDTEMLVWGGSDGSRYLNTGGRYDPATDTWADTSLVEAPSARVRPTAVWTGREMIVWGGFPDTNTGGRYDPETNIWAATSLVDAPSPRADHTVVWTGTEMLVWGGCCNLNTGGRYCVNADREGKSQR